MLTTITDRIARLIAHVGGIALVAMMLLLILNIVMRLVATPIHGTYELVSLFAVLVSGLSLAEAQATKSHVAIDLVIERLSARKQLLVAAGVAIVSIVLFVQITMSLWSYGLNQMRQGAATESLHIPYWPAVMILMVGVIALVLSLVGDLDRIRRAWRTPGELAGIW